MSDWSPSSQAAKSDGTASPVRAGSGAALQASKASVANALRVSSGDFAPASTVLSEGITTSAGLSSAAGRSEPRSQPQDAERRQHSSRSPSPLVLREEQLNSRRAREAAAAADSSFRPMILCTLRNLGNTCYFNSGVQLLSNCPEFVYALRDSAFSSPQGGAALLLSRNSTPNTHALYRAFTQLLSSMENKAGSLRDPLSPDRAVNQLGAVYPAFEGRGQQDCTEMLTAVLANTEDEGRQDVEVDVLLRGFEEAAVATDLFGLSSEQGLSSPVRQLLQQDDGFPAHGAASPGSSAAVGGVRPRAKEPFSPLSPAPRDGRRPTSPAEAHRLADDEGADALPADSVVTLPGPWSAHFMTLLRTMRRVNAENAALERAAAARKGKPYDPVSGFRPPRLHFNAATDGFKGYTLSEIVCKSCGASSRIVEPFTSLLLDIPSQHQRALFAKRHPNVVRRDANGQPLRTKKKTSSVVWYNPLTYFSAMHQFFSHVFSPSVDYGLTLDECVDIHFEPAELRGSNRYKCESCGMVTDATKQEWLLSLPEYLLVHMKRFKSGQVFSGKKTDPVIFPISWTPLTEAQARESVLPASVNGGLRPEILDLRTHVHPDMHRFLADIPPCLQLPDEAAAAGTHPAPLAQSPTAPPHTGGNLTSTYALDGVVTHYGSLAGGHYTVFVRKRSERQDKWVFISDDEAAEANVDDVANTEEYMLLYRKQPMVQLHGAALELRNKARFYLLQAAESASGKPTAQRESSGKIVYLSHAWLQRAAFFCDPGPIMNRTCYCREEDRRRVASHFTQFPVGSTKVPEDVPHVHGPPAEWYCVPVAEEDYRAFFAAYGGDGPITPAAYEAFKADQQRFLAEIRRTSRGRL